MTLEHVLTQRFKKSTKWKVNNIYISTCKQNQEIPTKPGNSNSYKTRKFKFLQNQEIPFRKCFNFEIFYNEILKCLQICHK